VVVDSTSQETLDSAKICLDLDPNECTFSDSLGRFHFLFDAGRVISGSNAVSFTPNLRYSYGRFILANFGSGNGRLKIFDILGRRLFVKSFVSENGKKVVINTRGNAIGMSGLLFVRVEIGNQVETRKMVVLGASSMLVPFNAIRAEQLSHRKGLPKTAQIYDLRITRAGYHPRTYTPSQEVEILVKIELIRDNSGGINAFFDSLYKPAVEPDTTLYTILNRDTTDQGTTREICTTRKVDQTQSLESHALCNPSITSIWVSAVLDRNSISTGAYMPINLPRGPIQLVPSKGGILPRIPVATKSAVDGMINDSLVAQISSITNAAYKRVEINSESHFDLTLNASLSTSFMDLKSSFGFSSSTIQTRILISYIEAMFTVSVDRMDLRNPSDFFSPHVTVQDLEAAIDSNMMPVYISAITYGRQAFLIFTSDQSRTEIEAALGVSIDGAWASGSVDAKSSYQDLSTHGTITVMTFGGAGAGATTVSEFESWVDSAGGNGVPLSYEMRYLDDHSICGVNLFGTFTARDCQSYSLCEIPIPKPPAEAKYGVNIKNVQLDGQHDNLITRVTGGGTVNVVFDMDKLANTIPGCPEPDGCSCWLRIGFAGKTGNCVWTRFRHRQAITLVSDISTTLDVPAGTGIHYIGYDVFLEYDCYDAIDSKIAFEPDRYIGAVCVE
jgi:hypothetical protein